MVSMEKPEKLLQFSEALLDIFGLYWTSCLPRRFKEARSQALSSALFIFHKRLIDGREHVEEPRWLTLCLRFSIFT